MGHEVRLIHLVIGLKLTRIQAGHGGLSDNKFLCHLVGYVSLFESSPHLSADVVFEGHAYVSLDTLLQLEGLPPSAS